MSELLVTGKLKTVLPKENGTSKSGKDWVKQSFVIDTGEQYNPLVCFQLFGDKTKLIEGVNINSTLEVGFNVSSREYNGKYYHNLDAWKIKVLESQSVNSENVEKLKQEMDLAPTDEDDDAPF